MSTLAEIEVAADALSLEEKERLLRFLAIQLRRERTPLKPQTPSKEEMMTGFAGDETETTRGTHSVLDIPPVSVGRILRPLSSDDDLLDEMLEGRA